LLACRGLAIGHGGQALARGLSLELGAGQTLALVGGNGSGKTTLLRTIAGLIEPLDGSVTVRGLRPREAGRHLAWLGQFHPTNPMLPLRVVDVVRMARYPEHGLFRPLGPADHALVEAALDFVGMSTARKKTLGLLSGGQRQKVFLAYVLARRAPLVLLDEPLQNLDRDGGGLVARAVAGWREAGCAIVVATHDPHEAGRADWLMDLPLGTVGKVKNIENTLA
jgi:ABC-type Mn2+/Zn2+ transport system ATPase subunit